MQRKSKNLSNRLFALIFIVLLVCCTFFGCQKPRAQTPQQGVAFTDALGRKLVVAKQPKRVAALIGSFGDVWTLAGGTLCACAEDGWEDFNLPLDDAVNIGGAHSPSLELLLSANPDLVLASASTASNVALQDTLQRMGVTVAYFDVDNFSDYLDMLRICTEITERADLYQQNGLALQTQIQQIKSQYASAAIPVENRKILLLRAASSFVKAKGSHGTILGEMLADMGCFNIADNDTSLLENLSVEAVIRQQPRHIFVVTMGENTQAAMATLENMIKENPAWGTLDAVKANRLYIMDKRLFNLKPNARFAEAYQIVYEKLTEK